MSAKRQDQLAGPTPKSYLEQRPLASLCPCRWMDLREQLQRTFGTVYTIERELSGGGMSRVFVADELALKRKVVIKVLPVEMSGQLSAERFKREIGIAARLQHAHLVPLLSAGEVGGLPYFVMPYVDGETLRARIDRQGEMPLTQAVRILREVASALAYSHGHGVVHRDIKPDNVLLSGGAAMVTDSALPGPSVNRLRWAERDLPKSA